VAWVYAKTNQGGVTRFQAMYRDPAGRKRSAGTFSTEKAALRAAVKAQGKVEDGTWFDRSAGRISFADYVENVWWPSLHLELSTRAAYRCYIDKHFLPFFGAMAMQDVLPSHVQAWVTTAIAHGLSPRSVVKYHVLLHGIFKQAVRDRIILHNPTLDTRLPKIVKRQRRIVTPEEFDRLVVHIPTRWIPLVLTDIETGMRWGELVALRPRHINWLHRTITISETVVELSKKHSPTGERMVIKPYPKDDEPRTIAVTDDLIGVLAQRVKAYALSGDDFLFSSTPGSGIPVSRNTFRTRVWQPALEKAALGFHVRIHDLRHAHASWLLAGGADLASVMERLGHRQITTAQQYLHTLPGADRKALDSFIKIRKRSFPEH
jgi:integrase